MMKANVSVLVIALSAATSLPALGQTPEGPEIYGRINLTLDHEDQDSDISGNDFSEWQLNSNNSRIGLKGEAELNPGLTVIYQMEWRVNVDGDGDTFSTRNTFVGLRGDYGTILGGKHDTPTKLIQNSIDQFDNLPGDIDHIFEGENRLNDMVLYRSPLLGNVFTVSFAFIPGEDEADAGGDNAVRGDSLADGKSFSLEYAPSDSFYLALGVDRDINGLDLERLAGQFTFGNLQLGTMLEFYEDDAGTVDTRAALVSLGCTQGPNVFKLQAGLADDRIDDGERETFTIGYDYKMAASTRFMSYFTIEQEENAVGDETKQNIFGVGLEHRF